MPKRRSEPIVLRNGVWWIDTRYNNRRWKESTGRTRKAEAWVVYKSKLGQFLLPPDPVTTYTVREALRDYYTYCRRRYDRGNLSAASLEIAETKSRHLNKHLPDGLLANDVRPSHAEMYAETRFGEGMAPETVRKELQTLISALRYADRMDRCTVKLDYLMPVDLRQRQGKTVYKARSRHLTPKEFSKLLRKLPKERRAYLLAYVYTGASRGELRRCTVGDLDRRLWALHLPGRKAANRDRWLPVRPALRPILSAAVKGKKKGDLLFEPWGKTGTAGNNALRRACVKAGIAHVSFNDLRRTFNSWLRNAGADEGKVAAMMGHHNVQMGRKIYTRWEHDTFFEAINKMPDIPKNSQDRNETKPE